MRKLPRWLESVIAEADKTTVQMPYARGTRTPMWKRDEEADQEEQLLRSA